MRAFLCGLLTLAPVVIGGCPTESSSVEQPAVSRSTDTGTYEWPIECFNPETGEIEPNCPLEDLQEAIAFMRFIRDPENVNDLDQDGIPNEEDPDVDGDGEPNKYDRDIDGDGVANGVDRDADADGKSGKDDPDEDGDGLSDRFDLNDDGDGLFDEEDEDDDGDGDEEEGDDEEEPDDDDEPQPLDDLTEKQRAGTLTDDDRAMIAKEITDRLGNQRVNDIVLGAIQNLGNRADDLLRKDDGGGVPPQIAAVDAVYGQLGRALRQARRNAGIDPGDPTTDQAVLQALGEFIPRLQAMDELAKNFQIESIGELGRAVNDLRAGLGSANRVREFTQALTRSAATQPIDLEEDLELEKLTTGAALLGSTFDTTSGGDLLDAIRLIDSMVGTPEELADALRDVRDRGRQGDSFDDAVKEVTDGLIGTL